MFQESSNDLKLDDYLYEKYPDLQIAENGFINIYTDFNDEYEAIHHGVGIRNVSKKKLVALYGKESREFLHRISTNSIKDLEHYHKKNTLFTNEKGRLIDRATVIFLDDYLMLNGSNDNNIRLQKWLDRYIIMEKIKVEDVTNRYFQIEVCGPQADSFITLLYGKIVDNLTTNSIMRINEDNVRCFVYKAPEKDKLNRYILFGSTQEEIKIITAIHENTSVFDVKMIGEKAFDAFRVEKGFARFPNEINDSFNPYETELIDEVDSAKGCYIGQEVIARLDTYDKVQKQLYGITFEPDARPEGSLDVVNANNEVVGEVTSIAFSLKCKSFIGLGIIRKKAIESDQKFTAVNENASFKINLSKLPNC